MAPKQVMSRKQDILSTSPAAGPRERPAIPARIVVSFLEISPCPGFGAPRSFYSTFDLARASLESDSLSDLAGSTAAGPHGDNNERTSKIMSAKTLSTAVANRALLIDDDKFMLTVLRDMLRELGVVGITTAADGASGIAAFDRLKPAPELVVCDLNMPGSDGFQFMEHLGARGYLGGIVLVSGMDARTLSSASLMAKFHRLNILATLNKPVDETDLKMALAKLA